jgi:hypothetical protein
MHSRIHVRTYIASYIEAAAIIKHILKRIVATRSGWLWHGNSEFFMFDPRTGNAGIPRCMILFTYIYIQRGAPYLAKLVPITSTYGLW